jgi:hypothetical protein
VQITLNLVCLYYCMGWYHAHGRGNDISPLYKFFFLCLYLILQLLRGSQQRLCASRAIVLPGESSQGRPLTPIRLANADESMMIFTNQDREYARVACARPEGKRSSQLPSFVTLSGAKGLSGWADRSFAPLRMTIPALVVKVHYRPGEGIDGPLADKSAMRQ